LPRARLAGADPVEASDDGTPNFRALPVMSISAHCSAGRPRKPFDAAMFAQVQLIFRIERFLGHPAL
jgi:hypothetical protein